MKKRSVTVPELMFVIGTRAALAAGVALLVSEHLKDSTKLAAGITLMGIGAVTTIPAAKIFSPRKSVFSRLRLAA
ncbi:MAG TPA: hypothetical protein VER58_18850 [Thermoanaerobaculia bacterium]|nr:hypothetical protein [Thermoanaerobaculia bacterium]